MTPLDLTLIDELIRAWRGPTDYPAMVAARCEVLDDRRIPLRYYSEGRLWLAEARATWLEPELISDLGFRPPGPSIAG